MHAFRRTLIVAGLAAVAAGCGAGSQPAGERASGTMQVFMVAHPDDWQLFMGEVAFRAVRRGDHTIFLHTTAGDAGRGPAFWTSRERGALASAAFALGHVPPDDSASVSAQGLDAACRDTVVQGRSLHRCRMATTTTYFLRIPGGEVSGAGFAANGGASLAGLASGRIASVAPLQGEGSHRGLAELRDLIGTVIEAERAAGGHSGVRIHTTDPDSLENPGDHSDHRITGHLAAELAEAHDWALSRYAGYTIQYRPSNLTAEQFATKAALFMAYDRARVLTDPASSAFCELPGGYSRLLSRTYPRPLVALRNPF